MSVWSPRSRVSGLNTIEVAYPPANPPACAKLSTPGKTTQAGGVTILAPLNLPATMPFHASLLFSRNLTAFVLAFTRDNAFQLDFTDDIQQGALITHDGEVRHARTREALAKVGV